MFLPMANSVLNDVPDPIMVVLSTLPVIVPEPVTLEAMPVIILLLALALIVPVTDTKLLIINTLVL